ncbi:DMT family transporter [Myroides sp. LJL116]
MFKNPRVSLLIGILCISIFPVLIKLNLTPSLISAFYRMFIAAIVILPFAIITKRLELYDFKTMALIALGGVFFGSDIAVWNYAIVGSTATQATLLTNLAPVWVGVGSYFFMSNKPSANFWIGTVFALVGMVVLVGVDVFIDLSFNLPFLMGILSGILYACYILVSKLVLDKVDVIPFMSYSLTFSSIFLALINLFMGSEFTGFSSMGWLTLIIQGLVCQLLAWFCISYATKSMRATRVSLSLLSQVLFSGLLAWFFIDETITYNMLIGGVILLFGIAITFYNKPLIGKKS